MAILRITASADNTITDAYEVNLTTRGTGSNLGASDILEIFSIYGQQSSSSYEYARVLIHFPLDEITTRRAANTMPASGSVEFHLKLYNAIHTEQVPEDFQLFIVPISQSWEEGTGLDMVEYTDLTYNREGSNWINRASGSTWATQGGDYLFAEALTSSFETGLEDLSIDVSDIVEKWIKGLAGGYYNNYGFGIKLSTANEATPESFYTKKFFARNTEFYFKRPVIEARWDDTTKDDRGNFYFSSSLMTADQNLNKIYLYNKPRGRLTNIPAIGTGQLSASLYETLGGSALATFTAGHSSTGIYSASVHLTGTQSKLYDVWHNGAGTEYYTGSIIPKTHTAEEYSDNQKYVVTIRNLKSKYCYDQTARLRFYIRKKNWSPNIYTVAQNSPQNLIIEDAVYRTYRIEDGEEIIPYSTGSLKFTQLSYDVSGNYADIDFSSYETGYQYGLQLSFYDDYVSSYVEQPYVFKFRVVE
ncbi:MAG: hypothetical protein GOVbin1807_135 [Prokaryotic dsDNA virus sp.]|nr:MAG: hypothetical protein GOVbin1807_135 [Prokaryotic dsDNA virus sp.]|tara:strand:- start:7484 stop:8902 length:1419 start_codon:yes stop_codon:yes gene_type:complete